MPIILIIAVVAAGGVGVAAENSLPGDALHTIKVNVNEELRGALTFSAEGKANWEARRAERRLEEFEELSAKGRITADAAAQIKQNFEEHADRVQSRVETFEARSDFKAAADVTANFETSLRAHEQVIARITATEAETQSGINAVLSSVRARISSNAEARTQAEIRVASGEGPEVEAAARGALVAAENKIAEAQGFIERVKAQLSAQASAEAEAKLQAAANMVVQGKAKLDAKAYGEAFLFFQQAIRFAQEAQMTAQIRVDVSAQVQVGGNVEVGTTSRSESGAGAEGQVEIRIGL